MYGKESAWETYFECVPEFACSEKDDECFQYLFYNLLSRPQNNKKRTPNTKKRTRNTKISNTLAAEAQDGFLSAENTHTHTHRECCTSSAAARSLPPASDVPLYLV